MGFTIWFNDFGSFFLTLFKNLMKTCGLGKLPY